MLNRVVFFITFCYCTNLVNAQILNFEQFRAAYAPELSKFTIEQDSSYYYSFSTPKDSILAQISVNKFNQKNQNSYSYLLNPNRTLVETLTSYYLSPLHNILEIKRLPDTPKPNDSLYLTWRIDTYLNNKNLRDSIKNINAYWNPNYTKTYSKSYFQYDSRGNLIETQGFFSDDAKKYTPTETTKNIYTMDNQLIKTFHSFKDSTLYYYPTDTTEETSSYYNSSYPQSKTFSLFWDKSKRLIKYYKNYNYDSSSNSYKYVGGTYQEYNTKGNLSSITFDMVNTKFGYLMYYDDCDNMRLAIGRQQLANQTNFQMTGKTYYFYSCNKINNPELKENNFVLYPNPVHDYLNIETVNEFEQVFIFDIYGKLCMNFSCEKKQLNLSNLASGIYFVQLKNNNEQTIVKKIIKE
jgi:hypothetical protein